MAKLTMDWAADPVPQKGDLLAFPKTTYIVLTVSKVKRRDPNAGPRFKIWAVRPEELEEKTLDLLSRAAYRRVSALDGRSGPLEFPCYWHKREKKTKSFEQLMKKA